MQDQKGKIISVIGPVVDVKFPEGQLPNVYDALKVKNEYSGEELVLEVEQLIGDDTARCVAMDSTDGIRRGQEVINTQESIKVPVGDSTLGRMVNLLGKPIDERKRLKGKSTGQSTGTLLR